MPLPESTIAVPSAGSANVRTLQITALIGGEPAIVQLQVMSIADESGNIVGAFSDHLLLRELLEELRAVRRGAEQFLGVRLQHDPTSLER